MPSLLNTWFSITGCSVHQANCSNCSPLPAAYKKSVFIKEGQKVQVTQRKLISNKSIGKNNHLQASTGKHVKSWNQSIFSLKSQIDFGGMSIN